MLIRRLDPCCRCGVYVRDNDSLAPLCAVHRTRASSLPFWLAAALFGVVWRRLVFPRAARGSAFWRRLRERMSNHARQRIDRLNPGFVVEG